MEANIRIFRICLMAAMSLTAGITYAEPPAAADTGMLTVTSEASTQSTPKPVVLYNSAYRSIFYSKETMERIRDAAEQYQSRQLSPSDPLLAVKTAGQDITNMLLQRRFYLSSLVYHSPDDWGIWLHGQSFNPQKPQYADLRVTNVNKEQATFVWTPPQFSFYVKRHPKSDNPAIQIDPIEKSITFSLYANQTFNPAQMRIEEGGGGDSSIIEFPDIMNAPVVSQPTSAVPATQQPSETGLPLPQVPETSTTSDGLPIAPLPGVPSFGLKDSTSH